jgi:magnesium transporter
MRREILSGLLLGATLCILGIGLILIWNIFSDTFGIYYISIALTVGLSLVGVVLWGTLVGSMLPLLLKKLGADPAASSTPFVATLVDVTGLIIYFSMAFAILSDKLL